MFSLKVGFSRFCSGREPSVLTMINSAYPTNGRDPQIGHGCGGMPTGLRVREVVSSTTDYRRYARAFAFFYTIGLHILLFTCLYRMSALSYLSNGQEDILVGDTTQNLPHAL
ncbi:hypothetical protein ACLB2K_051972 [Fragaria x ananassa]